MKNFTSDKIAVLGLVSALILSIIASVWTGNGVELQTTIAGVLGGYIGRVLQEEQRKGSD